MLFTDKIFLDIRIPESHSCMSFNFEISKRQLLAVWGFFLLFLSTSFKIKVMTELSSCTL